MIIIFFGLIKESNIRQEVPITNNVIKNIKTYILVDAGFEPAKALPSDLQSDPFDRSGNPPVARTEGIEPPPAVLETAILPLNYVRT